MPNATFQPPIPALRRSLLRWYDAHQRDLPWRAANAPYKVWVSEIMLQQTRVEVVIPYYQRFLRRFPTVRALAHASEQEVMSLWSGLGYYRRARMLHQAAKTVVAEHRSRLPQTAAGLRSLPGIGRYTASAIASICFGERTAVVDGNVERVLQRLLGKTLPVDAQWQLANQLLAPARPGDFNQAMMELGATVCTPLAPSCARCPLRKYCVQQGHIASSARAPKKLRRTLRYALDFRGGKIKLVQRAAAESLMPLMWELPQWETRSMAAEIRLRHSITSTDYCVLVYRERSSRGKYITLGSALQLPLTGLTRKALRAAALV